jgi:hypothetical protein
MDSTEEKTPLQQLRADLAKSCPNLPDYRIIELCQDYGISYEVPDVNSYRLITLLAAAENRLMTRLEY